MSKFRNRVIKGLKKILSHSDLLHSDLFQNYVKAISDLSICDVNEAQNRGKAYKDTKKYLSLYFSGIKYEWDLGEVNAIKKWLKKHIKRLESIEN